MTPAHPPAQSRCTSRRTLRRGHDHDPRTVVSAHGAAIRRSTAQSSSPGMRLPLSISGAAADHARRAPAFQSPLTWRNDAREGGRDRVQRVCRVGECTPAHAPAFSTEEGTRP